MNRTFVFVALSALFCACPPAMIADSGVDDAGEVVDYTGESTGSPPDFSGNLVDAGESYDAGLATVDSRCCKLFFRIPLDGEPVGATALLVGEQMPLSAGIPLTRTSTDFVANACFPMTSSAYYWYQFEFVSADAGSGGLDQGDGGYLVTTRRHNPSETNYSIGGERKNFIPAVASCAELDAGQGP